MQTFWPILFVILALAMAVGPIMMLRPSPWQRRLASQRAYALKLGLVVSAGEEELASGRKAMNYFLPLEDEKDGDKEQKCLLRRQSYSHEAHFYQEWDWASASVEPDLKPVQRDAIVDCINSLPSGCVALGQNRVGCYVAWSEYDKARNSEEAVEHIRSCLYHFRSAFNHT